MRKLIGAATLALVLAGCGSSTTTAGVVVRVDSNPFRISLLDDGKTLVAEDKDARLRYQLAATGDQHKLTKVISSSGDVYRVATDEPGRTATVTVARRPTGIAISVRFHPDTGIEQVYDAFDTSSGDHFLGGGERSTGIDLSGQILPVKTSDVCSYAPVPYFASSAGWGIRLATQNVAALAFPGSQGGGGCAFGAEPQCTFPPLPQRAEVCVRGAKLDEDLYAGDFAQTLSDYEADAGRPVDPPASELALIKWRDVDNGEADVLQDVTKLQAAQIPLGWVLVDNPWESCVGTLAFDPKRFPNPQGMIAAVHARRVRFMLWVSPKTQCDVGYSRAQLLGNPSAGQDEIDLRNKEALALFQSRLRRLAALGVDGVKADRGDEVDVEGKGESLQNEYPLLYARAVLGAFPTGTPAIFRAGAMGSQAVVPGIWAGDQDGTWSGLEQAILAGESAAMSGFPTWGSDVGGYHSSGLTGDVFARWAQLGAISPVLEVGGQGANATPWTLGQSAMTALRDAAVLHYELYPLFRSLLASGLPVLRPLAYAFPADAKAWANQYELMVGPDLLAALVTAPGTTPSIYLPAGSWVDLHTGQTVKGPTAFTRTTPLEQLPLYARAGSVVPFDLRTTDSWWGVDELSHAGRAGYLVTPGAAVELRGLPHDVQLWVPASSRPASVTVGGKQVSFSWNTGAFPGVVVRVHGPAVRGRVVLHP